MKVTIGGDRLGAGKKMQTDLHNYSRSTHNLSELFMSSMAPGVLYPFMTKIALNGDTFDIDLNAACRTIPTKGPLFGSYKFQVDVFSVPIRLYQGILHNNPVNIGLKMNQVKFPMLQLYHNADTITENNNQMNDSCLLKYLGLSGIGIPDPDDSDIQDGIIFRNINALPALAYYDIFKNYYANKQESKAYVITSSTITTKTSELTKWSLITWDAEEPSTKTYTPGEGEDTISTEKLNIQTIASTIITGSHLSLKSIDIYITGYDGADANMSWSGTLKEANEMGYIDAHMIADTGDIQLTFYPNNLRADNDNMNYFTFTLEPNSKLVATTNIDLVDFDLKNIDDMRNKLLSYNTLNQRVTIADDGHTFYPYLTLVKTDDDYNSFNICEMNGLCLKTYQSDIYNSWIQTEWIDGDNGIAALTAVDTSSGNFTMDALNLAQKLYNMMNRIAVSGGTFEDWQEAVYTQNAVRKAESPIYCGGLSKEIVFEEVISTAATQTTDTGGSVQDNTLGQLGGRGTFNDKHKGGHIIVKVNEPSIIMGIVSITPRITYSQGNEWYLTELDTMDDLHKPALDGIGFQDLIGERMAWFDSRIDHYGVATRRSYGKSPAWIDYMTSVNKCYGDFAKQGGKSFMVLNRNYEMGTKGKIKDFTTYVDPRKYNYVFAYNELAAQNFWVQIHSNIIARRLMSAKIIPNL